MLSDGRRIELERKEAGLLAYLALEGSATRSRVAGLLWPEGGEERARSNLRQRLTRLRRSVGEIVVDDGRALRLAPGVTLDTDGASQLLATLHYDDCAEFDEWLARRRCAGQAQERERLLAEGQRQLDAGRFAEAVEMAERAIAVDPAVEEGYCKLMRWYYLRGDRGAAIAVWDRCKEVLRREYGVLPSPQTTLLGHAIVGSQRPATIPWPYRAVPLTVLRPPRLIGRRRPLQQMRSAWSHGQMFLVQGEAGIGKTRLLAEFAGNDRALISTGARVGDRAAPYSTLARLVTAANEQFRPALAPEVALDVGRLLPQLLPAGRKAPALATDADGLRFLKSLRSYARACRDAGAMGVLIDDLQFADSASASVLHHLFDPGRCLQESWRAGFATRHEPAAVASREFVESLKTSWQVAVVRLDPLETTDVATLVQSLQIDELCANVWIDALARHAGGNPAYLLETIKTLLAEGPVACIPDTLPLPATVEAAIRGRLDQLTPSALALAHLASVAESAFSVALASKTLARPPLELTAAFAELENAQIMKGSAFAGRIVLAATLRSVPEAIRQVLLQLVAEHVGSDQRPAPDQRRFPDPQPQ